MMYVGRLESGRWETEDGWWRMEDGIIVTEWPWTCVSA